MKNKLCFLLLLQFLATINLYSTSLNNIQYHFKTLDIKDGLSQNTVHTILQDKQGFMWFGTKDGLNRYDGLSFRVFRKENDQLGNNFIKVLHEDKDGKIWIGTDAGVYIYSPLEESFEHFTVSTDDNVIIDRSVTCIKSDSKGDIWISADSQGLFHYDPQQKILKNYLSDYFLDRDPSNVTCFWFDSKGVCWISLYDDNLYYSTDYFNTLHPFVTPEGKQPFKGDIINKLLSASNDKLYIGSSKGGLKELDLKTNDIRDLLLRNKNGENIYVREITFYSQNELWLGTESGIYIYNILSGTSIHLETSVGDPYSLADNAIYSLYKDSEGGMWIGSYFGGINYYPKQYTYFNKFYPSDKHESLGRRVREFCPGNDGTIWIGTEDKGLFNYNPHTGAIVPFAHPAIYHNVHGLCVDDDYLWVGTFSGGLNRIDLRTKSVKTYLKGINSNSLNANDIFSILRTKEKGEIWIGTTYGMHRYNRKTDDFTRIPEMNGIFVYNIQEDSKGNLWIATYANGVYRFNVQENSWKNYTYDKNTPESLPYDKVLSIFEDSKGHLWFTTQGNGFCRFNPQTETFTTYDSSKGFPSNVIYRIIEDDNSLFWITTNEGLVRFNPDTNEMKVFTTANGLLSNQFNYQSGFKDENGNIYFGSINGFISFNPSTFIDNTILPPVVITDFLLFNKRVSAQQDKSPLKNSIVFSNEIELNANQHTFSFRVASLSYQAPEMNKLTYKLEDFDQEWYTVDQSPVITYSNLPYGTYRLMVKGSNSDGYWNPRPTSLLIHIHPPFYLSVWAYLVYILLLAGLITYVFYHIKRRNEKKNMRIMEKFEQEKERELYTAKIDFFTNVAHEIRTPLTLIKSPLETILKANNLNTDIKEDLTIMNQNTNRLLDLTNQLLDFRKTESKGFKLNFVNSDISAILKGVYTRFTPFARERGIEFNLELPTEPVKADVDHEAVTKIISNLFSNAIKHSDTYIRVRLYKDDDKDCFYLSVSNDGRLIPKEMREEIFKPFVQYKEGEKDIVTGTGIGLALSRSLAELHDGNLFIEDNPECNCFVLSLPVKQEQVVQILVEDVEIRKEITEQQEEKKEEKSRYTILIAEDNPDMLRYIKKQLVTSYTILTAGNGVKALELLSENHVNLIISDIMMPEMDGLSLCDRIKSDLEFSHIPVILLTAKTNIQSKIDGMKSGADAYIDKPFSMEYLKACISNLLSSREKLRAAFANSPFTSANSMAMSKADEKFLKTLNEIVLTNMQNPDFCLDDMASILNMSRSSLNRKIKGTLDLTPNDYIRLERLKKAAQLLSEGECRVNEICYMVGFNTPSYFTKCFQKQFGVLPKDFVRRSS